MSRAAVIPYLMFAFICVVWGVNWLAMKIGIAHVPPGVFSGLRWSLAGAVMLAWRGLRGLPVRFPPRLAGRLVLLSVLMISANAVIMLYGLRHVGTGLAAVINSGLTPLALLGFGAAMGQERLSLRHLVALAIGLVGIGLLYGPKALAGRLDTMEVLGAAGVAIGNLSYCLGSVMARPIMRTMDPALMAGVTNFTGGMILLVFAAAFEPGAGEALRLAWPVEAWWMFIYLTTVASLAATTCYFVLVRDWGPGRTGTWAFVSPPIAVLMGVFLNHEQVGLFDGLGMAMMLLAAGVVLRRR